ncbi:MAG: hypothetical protein GY839_12345 [candidate division Zixibacteria bacterium]|nr:hypothetical protein [candidate division Zixibacteria bacterium]
MLSIFQNNPDKLLSQATEMKDKGKFDKAIEKLKNAYIAIAKSKTIYPIGTFLRLPIYLQQANKNDEAWKEFNSLLLNGYANQIKDPDLIPMDHCAIYDKMRLFLQREKRFKKSIIFGIYSFISWGIGLYYQNRKDELKIYISNENMDKQISKLLKKAKIIDKKDEIINIIYTHINLLPKIDFKQLGNEISLIITD